MPNNISWSEGDVVNDREIGAKLPPLRMILRKAAGQKIKGHLPSKLIEVYEVMDNTFVQDKIRIKTIQHWAQKLDIIN